MSDPLPPPGWYPDPERPSQQRWWDGQQWAAPAEPPPPPRDATQEMTSAPGQQAPGQPSWSTGEASWQAGQAAPESVTWTQPAGPKTSGMAIAALILSLLWVCGLGSVAAVVLGILALRQIRESGQQVGGRGLAISGIVIGALGIVGGILSLVLLFSAGDTIGGVFDCALDPDATEAEIERCVEDLLDDSIR